MKTKDIFIWKDETFTVKTLNGDIRSSLSKNITKQAARVMDGEKISTQFAIGDQKREDLWEKCEKNWSEATPQLAPVNVIESREFVHQSPELSPQEFEKAVALACAEFVKKYPDFIPQGQFDYQRRFREFAQENGKRKTSSFTTVEGGIYFKHKNSSSIIDHGIGVKGDSRLNLNEIFQVQEEFLSKWNVEVPLNSGKRNICFYDERGVLLSKIRESLLPELYHSGSALFSNTAGKKIFHEDFSLFDEMSLPEHSKYLRFDHEGTSTSTRHALVDGGFFQGPVYDLRTAKKFGASSTGHGLRGGIPQGTISPGPFSMCLAAGKKTIPEYFGDLGETIVVLLMAGGDNTADGEFSSPVMTSFLVKDGKVQGRLPQLTLRGNIKRFLGEDFIGTSRDRGATGLDYALFTKMDVFVN